MKKLSVVVIITLLLFSVQGLDAKIKLNDNNIPDEVLYSLVQKYRGYTLINAKKVGVRDTEAYRAVLMRNGVLKEVALSPQGGIRGEVFLDGHADHYREGQESVYLDKSLRKGLIAQGFNKKAYRRNVDHRVETNDRYRYARYNHYPFYRYRLYYPRYYRIYAF